MIKVKDIIDLINVDSESGVITWKLRDSARPQWNARFAGKRAGNEFQGRTGGKYRRIRFTVNGETATLLEHRIIWEFVYGEIPDGMEIDHIDKDSTNNSISNLRVCNRIQNSSNKDRHVDNTSGYKGVSYFKQTGKFRARIMHNGNDMHIGYFDTAEGAHRAYMLKQAELCGEFARG